jgi:hypothetical protein
MNDDQLTVFVAGVIATGLLALGLLKLYWRVDAFLNDPLPGWDDWRLLD